MYSEDISVFKNTCYLVKKSCGKLDKKIIYIEVLKGEITNQVVYQVNKDLKNYGSSDQQTMDQKEPLGCNNFAIQLIKSCDEIQTDQFTGQCWLLKE